jgi:atypical dual specificity phosphatase
MVNVSRCGETFHHNNPSPLTDNLYISAARAISPRVLRDLGITCVINATLELPTMAYQLTDCLQIAVEDRIASKLYVYFDLVADKINSIHLADGKLMIYCRAGMSRSASLCIAYFMKYHGMTVDEAYQYVRARRPIIHPNIGFMRQLRDYEKRLNSKEPEVVLPSLTFASECCAATTVDSEECGTGFVDYESGIKVIKPKPKPRQPKIRYSDLLESCAESCPPTIVHLCGILGDVDNCADGDGGGGAGEKAVSHMSGESFAFALVRSSSPMLETTTDQAEVNRTTPTPFSLSPSSSQKRKPFCKISEPAKIAVSFLIVALERLADSSEAAIYAAAATLRDRASYQILSFSLSVFTEQLQSLPQVAEEIHLECLGDFPQKALTDDDAHAYNADAASPSTATKTAKQKTSLIARQNQQMAVLTKSHFVAITTFVQETLEREGIFKRQAVDQAYVAAAMGKRPRLERTKSIRVPGLKISPLPAEYRKTPQLADEPFFAVAACTAPPITLERVREGTVPCRWDIHHATSAVSVHMKCAAIDDRSTFEFGSRNPNYKLKLAWLLTVPLRTSVCSDAAVQVAQSFIEESEKVIPMAEALPSTEHPCYSMVKKEKVAAPENAQLSVAREEPLIESCWFFALAARKSTKSVCMVPKVNVKQPAEVDMSKRKRYLEPEMHWAAERYHIELSGNEYTRQLESFKYATASRIFSGERLRMAQCCFDHKIFELNRPKPLPRLKVCLYNAWSITTISFPLMSVAESHSPEPLEMNNMYCKSTTLPQNSRRCLQKSAFRSAATVTCADVQSEEGSGGGGGGHGAAAAELVDIPDAFGDISTLKKKIMEQNDPVKISIWLEVFKRSVIVSRPIYPFVVVAELLPVAAKEDVGCGVEEDSFLWESIDDLREQYGFALKTNLEQFYVETFETVSEELIDYDCFCHCFAKADLLVDCVVNSTMLVCAIAIVNIILEDLLFYEQQTTVAAAAAWQKANADYLLHPVTGCVASCATNDPIGTSVKRHQDVPVEFLLRKPFQMLTTLYLAPPTQRGREVDLFDLFRLLDYEYVQDIEDQADLAYHYDMPDLVVSLVKEPVDTLWFFELEKPGEVGLAGGAKAAALIRPVTPFQLFLPDSYLIDKVGQEGMDVFKADEEDEKDDTAEKEQNSISKPLELIPSEIRRPKDLISGSVKPRATCSDKRVSFRNSQESLTSRGSRPTSGLVSFQRPSRTRSVSRSRSNTSSLSAVGTASVSDDAKTMAHLTASMKQAEAILEKRRSHSSTRSPRMDKLETEDRRSRAAAAEQSYSRTLSDYLPQRYSSSSSSSASVVGAKATSNSRGDSSSSSGVKGIFETAQNWISSRRSSVKGRQQQRYT